MKGCAGYEAWFCSYLGYDVLLQHREMGFSYPRIHHEYLSPGYWWPQSICAIDVHQNKPANTEHVQTLDSNFLSALIANSVLLWAYPQSPSHFQALSYFWKQLHDSSDSLHWCQHVPVSTTAQDRGAVDADKPALSLPRASFLSALRKLHALRRRCVFLSCHLKPCLEIRGKHASLFFQNSPGSIFTFHINGMWAYPGFLKEATVFTCSNTFTGYFKNTIMNGILWEGDWKPLSQPGLV